MLKNIYYYQWWEQLCYFILFSFIFRNLFDKKCFFNIINVIAVLFNAP